MRHRRPPPPTSPPRGHRHQAGDEDRQRHLYGDEADKDRRATLTDAVVESLGKPFKPGGIVFVDDLPRTRNGKILRRGVRAKAIGEDPGDLSSLGNPEALDGIGKVL